MVFIVLALSMVLENTAFVGDILLRLPDATHALLKDNREWNLLVEWAVRFCNDTLIFEGSDELLLNTVSLLNLIILVWKVNGSLTTSLS